MDQTFKTAVEAFDTATTSPRDVPDLLRAVAEKYRDDAAALDEAWQDRTAGLPWRVIAREFERLADKLAKVLP